VYVGVRRPVDFLILGLILKANWSPKGFIPHHASKLKGTVMAVKYRYRLCRPDLKKKSYKVNSREEEPQKQERAGRSFRVVSILYICFVNVWIVLQFKILNVCFANGSNGSAPLNLRIRLELDQYHFFRPIPIFY